MTADPMPSFRETLVVWFRVGCLSFGGPAGQIALLHREVVGRPVVSRRGCCLSSPVRW
jgi:chromate transport protein ChrA